jgi:hypothetical protein
MPPVNSFPPQARIYNGGKKPGIARQFGLTLIVTSEAKGFGVEV